MEGEVTGRIIKVSGPLIVAEGMSGAKMYDVVRVSEARLIGEIIEMRGDLAWIQVYEDTGGLGPGEPVVSTGVPLSVELGPGLIEAIYDGIQRPLDAIRARVGDRITRGVEVPALDREKKWHFTPRLAAGAEVVAGDILGVVQETPVVEHRILVPVGYEGIIEEIREGDFTIEEWVARVRQGDQVREITMLQRWPVRRGRPYKEKLAPEQPLISGQRVIDTFFPVAKGGTAAIPGPFGSGKCVSGETPVLLTDGSLWTIAALYERCNREGKIKKAIRQGTEEILELLEPLPVFTVTDKGIKRTQATVLYKGKSDTLLRIKTRTGRVMEVTPVHKLFQVTARAEVREREARTLKVGDYLLAPRCEALRRCLGNPQFGRVRDYLNGTETSYMTEGTLALAPEFVWEDTYCDEIVAIEEIPGPHDVYDLTVPKTHNFIGGFGPCVLHNTVVQHQLAKWADADIIVYIGCGERGNEMTDVLLEFPELSDPRSGEPLMKRTVLVANTSDMPVAAREASIYTGITIAEYFRDMGYNVALMADSTSRWAEALREMSGRLEEMPGEEGYPAYLSSRLAEFYERTGRVICLGQEGREATLTAIGAVSPPGGDLSEPVTQATLRIVKVFWGLDASLAYRRHFPAINWLLSYSLYADQLTPFFVREVGEEWVAMRNEALRLLQQEAELEEIVRLVGEDALSPRERLVLVTAQSLREDFLHQNAFHDVDTFTPLEKQAKMLGLILQFHHEAQAALEAGVSLGEIVELPVRERIGRAKYVPAEQRETLVEISRQITAEFARLRAEGEEKLA